MSDLGFDLAEFEAELASGMYDHLKPVQVKKAVKAQLKVVKKTKPKFNSTAHELLNAAPDHVTEIPQIVGYMQQELHITCSNCDCVHSFTLDTKVKRQYKNGRIHFVPHTETVAKEISALGIGHTLEVEKMASEMTVVECDNCREAEDF